MVRHYGDVRDELDEDLREEIFVCECGASVTLTLDHAGLDWPEKLEGWCHTQTGEHICPTCRPGLVW